MNSLFCNAKCRARKEMTDTKAGNMNKTELGKSPFSKLDHVGVVVRDLDKAIEYYQSLGIGPFEHRSMDKIAEKTLYGKADDSKVKIAMAQLGPIKIELIQPVAGTSVQQEFLDSRGEGINHLCFSVDDLDKEAARLVEKGLKVMFRTKRTGGGSVAYFDTRKVGDVIFELVFLLVKRY